MYLKYFVFHDHVYCIGVPILIPNILICPECKLKGRECVRIGWTICICHVLCPEPATGAHQQPAKYSGASTVARACATHAHAQPALIRSARARAPGTRAVQVRVHACSSSADALTAFTVTPSTTVYSSTATPAWPKYPDDDSRWLTRLGQYKRPRVSLQKAVCSGLASGNISLNYLLWSLVNCLLVLYV